MKRTVLLLLLWALPVLSMDNDADTVIQFDDFTNDKLMAGEFTKSSLDSPQGIGFLARARVAEKVGPRVVAGLTGNELQAISASCLYNDVEAQVYIIPKRPESNSKEIRQLMILAECIADAEWMMCKHGSGLSDDQLLALEVSRRNDIILLRAILENYNGSEWSKYLEFEDILNALTQTDKQWPPNTKVLPTSGYKVVKRALEVRKKNAATLTSLD